MLGGAGSSSASELAAVRASVSAFEVDALLQQLAARERACVLAGRSMARLVAELLERLAGEHAHVVLERGVLDVARERAERGARLEGQEGEGEGKRAWPLRAAPSPL